MGVQRAQRAGQQVDRDRAHRGDQTVQVRLGAPHRFLPGQAQPGRKPGDLSAQPRAVLDRLGDLLRHLVPVPEQRPLRAVQREPGLPGHELSERAGAAPPAAQRGHGGGFRDHHPGPVRLVPQDPVLPERGRPPRVDLRQDVRPPDPPFAASFTRQPRDPDGGDHGLRYHPVQRPRQARAVQRQHRRRPQVAVTQPLLDQRALCRGRRPGQQHQRLTTRPVARRGPR